MARSGGAGERNGGGRQLSPLRDFRAAMCSPAVGRGMVRWTDTLEQGLSEPESEYVL